MSPLYQHRVYVVSHDDLKRNLLQPLMEHCGGPFSITFCDYGAELLHELAATTADHMPTLIVLDAGNMQPDGLSTLRQIKTNKRFRSIPTILLVDAIQFETIQQGYQLGANAIVARPKLSQDLNEMCRYWLQMVLPPTKYFHELETDK